MSKGQQPTKGRTTQLAVRACVCGCVCVGGGGTGMYHPPHSALCTSNDRALKPNTHGRACLSKHVVERGVSTPPSAVHGERAPERVRRRWRASRGPQAGSPPGTCPNQKKETAERATASGQAPAQRHPLQHLQPRVADHTGTMHVVTGCKAGHNLHSTRHACCSAATHPIMRIATNTEPYRQRRRRRGSGEGQWQEPGSSGPLTE